jgi:anti-sigma factor RsiW
MNARPEIREEDLHAFIDGDLDAARSAEIADAEREDVALAERIAAFRADKKRLADVYTPLIEQKLPAEWLSRIADHGRGRRNAWWSTMTAIAASIVLLVAGLATYQQLPASGEESIVREALAARADMLEPSEVFAIASPSQARGAGRVMASALKMHLGVPDLSRMGYRLENMRIFENLPGGKSVELRYRDAANRDFALYFRHPSSGVRFDQYKRAGLRICVWQDDVLGTVMTGPISAAEMQRLASLAYTGLES